VLSFSPGKSSRGGREEGEGVGGQRFVISFSILLCMWNDRKKRKGQGLRKEGKKKKGKKKEGILPSSLPTKSSFKVAVVGRGKKKGNMRGPDRKKATPSTSSSHFDSPEEGEKGGGGKEASLPPKTSNIF